MTALGPYSQKTDYRHTYDLQDLRGPFPIFKFQKNSIADILDQHPQLSIFNYLVDTAGFRQKFNRIPGSDSYEDTYTIIASINDGYATVPESVYTNMDIGTAKSMVNAATISKILPKTTLTKGNTNTFYLLPDQYSRLQDSIDRIKVNVFAGQEVYFNGYAHLIDEIQASNGIILIVDKPILPLY